MPDWVYEASLERSFAASRGMVWGLVSDTNRWDRASGLAPGRYGWREEAGQRLRVGTAKELGFDIEWVEPPYEWIEAEFVHGERRFSKGPVERGGFRARLHDGGAGETRVSATAYVAGSGALMPILGRVMQSRFRSALARYFDGLAAVLGGPGAAARSEGSAAEAARDLIAEHTYDARTQGARSQTSLPELDRRLSRLAGAALPAGPVDRLRRLLAERPDEEIAQMRPFELADRWHLDRREVLKTFLHATRAGVTDLRWQINCPVCRVAAQVVGSLADVSGSVHCAACNIGYGVDFGKHVEAVFQCHPAIREVETTVFCASSPAFLPHVVAQVSCAPDGERREHAELGAGTYHVRLLSGSGGTDVELGEGESLSVAVEDGGLSAGGAAAGSEGGLAVKSRATRPEVVLVERTGFDARAAMGSTVASFPEFLDLFATEAPAAGVELAIAHLALLFSDLTGSTALYGELGDARAFAVVQEHFRDMNEIVAVHRGAIVKTMGDAVMATFVSEGDAVAAALAMIRRCRERHGGLGLGAKLGVAAGACLAVRANERLDYFGTTVNLAARLQARAAGGELVITQELSHSQPVAERLGTLPQRSFRASLKGITTEQELIAVRV